jgi:pseudouridine-5'-phosphate glycosidase
MAAADALGQRAAIVVANPVPAAEALAPDLHDRVLAEALAEATRRGLRGKAVTPFLLAAFHRETGGASLRTNIALVRNNVAVAAGIATAWAATRERQLAEQAKPRPMSRAEAFAAMEKARIQLRGVTGGDEVIERFRDDPRG